MQPISNVLGVTRTILTASLSWYVPTPTAVTPSAVRIVTTMQYRTKPNDVLVGAVSLYILYWNLSITFCTAEYMPKPMVANPMRMIGI